MGRNMNVELWVCFLSKHGIEVKQGVRIGKLHETSHLLSHYGTALAKSR